MAKENTMNQVERNAAIYRGELTGELTYTPVPQATFTKAISEHGGEIIITESDIDTRIDWSRTPINLDGETVAITHMAGHHIEGGTRYAAFRYAHITNPEYFTKPNRYAAKADRNGADYGVNGGIWDDM